MKETTWYPFSTYTSVASLDSSHQYNYACNDVKESSNSQLFFIGKKWEIDVPNFALLFYVNLKFCSFFVLIGVIS